MFVQHTLYNTDVHSQSASIDTSTIYFDSVWKKKILIDQIDELIA